MREERASLEEIVTLEQIPGNEHVVGGSIGITHEVVATIAGIAAREVPGVHALGGWRLIPFADRPRRGVNAEVGEVEAALDLEIVLEFGADIRKLAAAVRVAVAQAIDTMADRKVVEVNLKIAGIELPRPKTPSSTPPRSLR